MSINKKMFDLGNKRSVIRELFEFGKKRSAEIGAENVYDFSLGNPSVEPPKEINDTIKELINGDNTVLVHGYTSAQGDLSVRKAISDFINKNHGLNLTPDNIYMTCGAAASLTISLKAILNAGEECIVFAPFFTEYKVFIENAGGVLVKSMPRESDLQIDVEDFASKITEKTRAVIINSPNNPSGVVYTEETIKAIAYVLQEKSKQFGNTIYLISDEPYRELVYGNVKVPYLINYYKDTIVCYSYSKALSLPGERIGYIAVSPNAEDSKNLYLAICGAGRSLGYVCAPALFQKVVAKNVDKTCDISVYKENRDILLENLTNFGYTCVKPDGAFYLFIKTLEPNALEFCEKAKKYNILIVPCDDFGVEGYARISYCVSKERVVKSLPAFKALAEEYK
ncbi:MAG: pyridoxal phosphate-dependent aminotransferase [Clostridia bacterium]|nr:pyridoxal phosphate-dependent aminotransferase [Clostridia bacterium]